MVQKEPRSSTAAPSISTNQAIEQKNTREVSSFDAGYKPSEIPSEAKTPDSTSQPTVVTSIKNTAVSDSLNLADEQFKDGRDGCSSVRTAIFAANNPDTFGPVAAEQIAELKKICSQMWFALLKNGCSIAISDSHR